jgi:hypothetical protein
MSAKQPDSTAKPAGASSPKSGQGSKRSRKPRQPKDAKPSRARSTTPPTTPSIENSTAAKPETSDAGYPLRNTSELARDFDCDRAVVLKYLRKHKIKPYREREKLKEYELTPELETVLEEEIGSPKLSDVRLEDAEITRDTKRVNLEKARGRLVDFTDACEYFGRLINGLYNRLDSQYAPTAGPRLYRLKTAKEVTSALRRDLRKILGEFRADPGRFAK